MAKVNETKQGSKKSAAKSSKTAKQTKKPVAKPKPAPKATGKGAPIPTIPNTEKIGKLLTDLAACAVSREKKKIRAELRELGHRGGLKGARVHDGK